MEKWPQESLLLHVKLTLASTTDHAFIVTRVIHYQKIIIFLSPPAFAPTFSKYPLQPMTYATLKGNVTLVCRPEAAPAADKEWFKDRRNLNPSEDTLAR